MAGWDLKDGKLVSELVSEDEYWSLFNYVFSDSCSKRSTYKFGLVKSICDQIYDLVYDGVGYRLSYEKIFVKFTENYWNLVVKYELKQMRPDGRSDFSKIELIIKKVVQEKNIPSIMEYDSLDVKIRTLLAKEVAKECKKNVIGALYKDFQGKLYAFDLKAEGILLSEAAYSFIAKYKLEIEKLNYYSWAKFLESVNSDDALIRVINKLELSTPQRKDLSMYRDILFKEFEEDRCFYCGKKLNTKIHVDHFIPWSFVKNDNLWNFVLSCSKCNLQKNNRLAPSEFLVKIESRNQEILKGIENAKVISPVVIREFKSYSDNLLHKMWQYARMSGIRE